MAVATSETDDMNRVSHNTIRDSVKRGEDCYSVDRHNDLFVFPNGTINDRHQRITPVNIAAAGSVYAAAQTAVGAYNAATARR